jgi:hypothetical protein
MNGISIMAFLDEMEKIGGQTRLPGGTFTSQTVGAPRSKLPGAQSPKAPTAPGKLQSKIVSPASKFGKRQNYSQPNTATPQSTNPIQQEALRQTQPPNVVFGVR